MDKVEARALVQRFLDAVPHHLRAVFNERLRRGELVSVSFEEWASAWARVADAEPAPAADGGA